jgi:hypothetical protein
VGRKKIQQWTRRRWGGVNILASRPRKCTPSTLLGHAPNRPAAGRSRTRGFGRKGSDAARPGDEPRAFAVVDSIYGALNSGPRRSG